MSNRIQEGCSFFCSSSYRTIKENIAVLSCCILIISILGLLLHHSNINNVKLISGGLVACICIIITGIFIKNFIRIYNEQTVAEALHHYGFQYDPVQGCWTLQTYFKEDVAEIKRRFLSACPVYVDPVGPADPLLSNLRAYPWDLNRPVLD